MAMDSYSQALQGRRGKSVDMSLVYGGQHDGDAGAHAVAESHGGPGGEGHGTPTEHEPTPSPAGVTEHMGEHTPPVHEGEHPAPPASRHSAEHEDEHIDVEHEMRGHMIGHVSPGEEERLSDMKPRSLGERVKMEAMKRK